MQQSAVIFTIYRLYLLYIEIMAAFEAISRISVRPHNQMSLIDMRSAHLPQDAPMDDYDPKKYREPKKPIKVWMAYFNLIRTSFGPGVLGMPLAISQTGIVLGPFLSMAVGCLIVHTHFTLLWCLNEVSRQLKIPYISYRYGFRLALLHGPGVCQYIGHYGPSLIATFMIMSQIAICAVAIIFTSDSLRDIMDWPSTRYALLFMLVPIILLELILKTLNIMSYIAMISNFVTFSGIAIILYYIADSPPSEVNLCCVNTLTMVFSFGTFLFNLSALGVILSIDKSLVDPTIMTTRFGVINVGMLFPAIFGTIFGCLGYWSFGTMEENILRSLPFDEATAMVAIGLYSIAVVFAYSVQSYPGIQIVIEVIKNLDDAPSEKTLELMEYLIRLLFVLLTFLISYLAPFQAPFVAFAGNLCTIQLALVFPALMELSLLYPSRFGKYKMYLIKDMTIILTGILFWFIGVYHCGYLMYIRVLAMDASNAVE